LRKYPNAKMRDDTVGMYLTRVSVKDLRCLAENLGTTHASTMHRLHEFSDGAGGLIRQTNDADVFANDIDSTSLVFGEARNARQRNLIFELICVSSHLLLMTSTHRSSGQSATITSNYQSALIVFGGGEHTK
jgi:hypothetical protein